MLRKNLFRLDDPLSDWTPRCAELTIEKKSIDRFRRLGLPAHEPTDLRRSGVPEEVLPVIDLDALVEPVAQDITTFLQGMIQIPSENPPGDVQRVAQYVVDTLTNWGMAADKMQASDAPRGRENVIARLGPAGPAALVFNAHLDTVPAGDPARWTLPPFSGTIRDGRVFGRGAVDSKGRLAAYFGAAYALHRAGVRLSRGVLVTATCDEEIGGEWGAGYVTQAGLVTADAAIVEGYSDLVSIAMAGMLEFAVTVTGQAAHASRPEQGANAIAAALPVLQWLDSWQDELAAVTSAIPGMGATTVNVGTIHGGTKSNVVPDQCVIEVDCRVIPEKSVDQLAAQVIAAIQAFEDSGCTYAVAITTQDPGWQTDPAHPLLQALDRGRAALRRPPLPREGTRGRADSVWFARQGIPVVDFGPGSWQTGNVHAPDENMAITDLLETVKVIVATILHVVDHPEAP